MSYECVARDAAKNLLHYLIVAATVAVAVAVAIADVADVAIAIALSIHFD